MRSHFTRSISLVITLLAILNLTACDVLPQITAFQDEAHRARENLDTTIARIEGVQQTLTDDDPRRPEIASALADAQRHRAAFDEVLTRLDDAIAETEVPTDSISGLAHAVAPLLPEPARLPLLLGGGLAVSLLRAGQLKRSAASIVSGFERAMSRDDQLRDAFGRNADLFRASQTPTAQRIVDEVKRRDTHMIRLPV